MHRSRTSCRGHRNGLVDKTVCRPFPSERNSAVGARYRCRVLHRNVETFLLLCSRLLELPESSVNRPDRSIVLVCPRISQSGNLLVECLCHRRRVVVECGTGRTGYVLPPDLRDTIAMPRAMNAAVRSRRSPGASSAPDELRAGNHQWCVPAAWRQDYCLHAAGRKYIHKLTASAVGRVTV